MSESLTKALYDALASTICCRCRFPLSAHLTGKAINKYVYEDGALHKSKCTAPSHTRQIEALRSGN